MQLIEFSKSKRLKKHSKVWNVSYLKFPMQIASVGMIHTVGFNKPIDPSLIHYGHSHIHCMYLYTHVCERQSSNI